MKQSIKSVLFKQWHIPRRIYYLFFCLLFIGLFIFEIKTSQLQALVFSRIAEKFSYQPENGASQDIRFPETGPFDIRLGYSRIPEWTLKMSKKGYAVAKQARWSPDLLKYTDMGLFTICREKSQGGICILDRYNEELLCNRFPERIYPDFESMPPVLVDMLLFIENRHLLDTDSPYQNPAIEWERLVKALLDAAIGLIDKDRNLIGGSTLATQLEKFRHSPRGITDTTGEKLKQIISSSLRTYYFGEKTFQARRQILLDYMNGIPLAAVPGFGEVMGIGDGLWAWYGLDFKTVTRLLFNAGEKDISSDQIKETGNALKSALSLFLAQRRPSAYLITHREDLENLTNTHFHLLAKAGVISPKIRDAAIASQLNFQEKASLSYPLEIYQKKAANFIRSNLMTTLGMDSFYGLDRLDLDVKTSIDAELQKKVTQILFSLKEPATIEKEKLREPRLLEKGDPSKVIYSFSLYERTPAGNMLRVQTNNYDGSFNIDEQMKLDMGSSAKLRVLVHYLDIMTKLYQLYQNLPYVKLRQLSADPNMDPLTRWATDYLSTMSDKSLVALLEAAMKRIYSANTSERFFTGGGLHTFANFDKEDNFRMMTVREAFQRSVNLVFIRIMRDINYYYIHQRYDITPRSLVKIDQSEKNRLLAVFADKEGIQFIHRFYNKYRGKSPDEAMELLFMSIPPTPYRLSATFRFLTPEATFEVFKSFIREHFPGSRLTDQYVKTLYTKYDPENYSLADTGYIVHIHPLELWLVGYLQRHPQATTAEVIEHSRDQRQAVYRWLFKTKSHRKQYQRIRTILELEAFQDIHREWKRLGYPFDYLVPSYASAIGSSGDRPSALADLVGIILNDGIFYPRVRVESLHFGKKTPYETFMVLLPAAGQQVIAPETAKIAKSALLDVVEQGTAIRLKNAAYSADGNRVLIGGKTGTGDHRYKTFDSKGNLLSSKAMNRTAIFAFFLGDCQFGTISVYVTGPEAASYAFSSSLPVSILKILLPHLMSSLDAKGDIEVFTFDT